jgi:hypothetical protein
LSQLIDLAEIFVTIKDPVLFEDSFTFALRRALYKVVDFTFESKFNSTCLPSSTNLQTTFKATSAVLEQDKLVTLTLVSFADLSIALKRIDFKEEADFALSLSEIEIVPAIELIESSDNVAKISKLFIMPPDFFIKFFFRIIIENHVTLFSLEFFTYS